jgi:hypothetical protein
MTETKTLLLRNTQVHNYKGVTQEKDQKWVLRVDLSCDATENVLDELSAGILPPYLASGPIRQSKLMASHLVLTPNEGVAQMAKYEIQLDVDSIGPFEFTRTKDENGSEVVPLTFQAITHAQGSSAKLEMYCAALGRHGGQMKISYSGTSVDAAQMTIGEAAEAGAAVHVLDASEAADEGSDESEDAPMVDEDNAVSDIQAMQERRKGRRGLAKVN